MFRFATLLALFGVLGAHAAFPQPRPSWKNRTATARWITATADYAVISTISTLIPGAAFGNMISTANITLADGRGGVPVVYVSPWDQSMQDLAKNNSISFTFTEAEDGICAPPGANDDKPDPEDPTCARLTMHGSLVNMTNSADKEAAKAQLFTLHPQMKEWPVGHDWEFLMLDIDFIWEIDFYGGGITIDPKDYWSFQW